MDSGRRAPRIRWVRPSIVGVPTDADAIDAMLLALMYVNLRCVALRGRPFPALYESGIRYYREPRGVESWQTLPALYASRRGDCEDLAAARAAELRVFGEDASARPVVYRAGERLWHVVVERAGGAHEDPSRVLGMRGAA